MKGFPKRTPQNGRMLLRLAVDMDYILTIWGDAENAAGGKGKPMDLGPQRYDPPELEDGIELKKELNIKVRSVTFTPNPATVSRDRETLVKADFKKNDVHADEGDNWESKPPMFKVRSNGLNRGLVSLRVRSSPFFPRAGESATITVAVLAGQNKVGEGAFRAVLRSVKIDQRPPHNRLLAYGQFEFRASIIPPPPAGQTFDYVWRHPQMVARVGQQEQATRGDFVPTSPGCVVEALGDHAVVVRRAGGQCILRFRTDVPSPVYGGAGYWDQFMDVEATQVADGAQLGVVGSDYTELHITRPYYAMCKAANLGGGLSVTNETEQGFTVSGNLPRDNNGNIYWHAHIQYTVYDQTGRNINESARSNDTAVAGRELLWINTRWNQNDQVVPNQNAHVRRQWHDWAQGGVSQELFTDNLECGIARTGELRAINPALGAAFEWVFRFVGCNNNDMLGRVYTGSSSDVRAAPHPVPDGHVWQAAVHFRTTQTGSPNHYYFIRDLTLPNGFELQAARTGGGFTPFSGRGTYTVRHLPSNERPGYSAYSVPGGR
ncbi:MAG TPA: hypothetical protein P5532_19535 [Planctomycetota bacterium]|nr:hypothetical protein [Planctomycetota bacterium]